MPGTVVSVQTGPLLRRPGPSRARAASAPASTRRSGFTTAINRCRNGRQTVISDALGRRPPAAATGSAASAATAPGPRPTLASMRSSKGSPSVPANGKHLPAVFGLAGRVADKHQAGVRVAGGEHQIGGGIAQGTAVERGQGRTKLIDGSRLPSGGGGTLRRRSGRDAGGTRAERGWAGGGCGRGWGC